MRRIPTALAALTLGAAAACSASTPTAASSPPAPATHQPVTHPVTHRVAHATTSGASQAAPLARHRFPFAHVVVVVEENHSYSEIIGNSDAAYMNRLARHGLLFTHSYGVTHPSQPNYIALFSGSTHGVTNDDCLQQFGSNNLGAQVRAAGLRFDGYSQSLPSTGSTVCTDGAYARKHVPWTDFSDLPGSVNKPFTRFPSDYSRLPAVSFVIPDLNHDMHDGTIAQADTWLHRRIGGYARWARSHRSLLIVTWDEDDRSSNNRIPTIAFGAGVPAERYRYRIDHYRLLRTIEAIYRLHPLGTAAHRSPIRILLGS